MVTVSALAFIRRRPSFALIEKILRHCGLWEEPGRGPPAASATADRAAVAQALVEAELTCVPIDEFLAEW